jgi:hypothetical protein
MNPPIAATPRQNERQVYAAVGSPRVEPHHCVVRLGGDPRRRSVGVRAGALVHFGGGSGFSTRAVFVKVNQCPKPRRPHNRERRDHQSVGGSTSHTARNRRLAPTPLVGDDRGSGTPRAGPRTSKINAVHRPALPLMPPVNQRFSPFSRFFDGHRRLRFSGIRGATPNAIWRAGSNWVGLLPDPSRSVAERGQRLSKFAHDLLASPRIWAMLEVLRRGALSAD